MATTNSTNTRVAAVSVTTDMEGKGIRISFGADGIEPLELNLSQLNEEILLQCTLHGLKQKLVDAAAISRNPDTGRPASVLDKCDAVREVAKRLVSGQWNKNREGGGGVSGGILLRALIRLYAGRKTEGELRAFLDSKSDAEKAALRKSGKIAPIIEEIRVEDAERKGIDVPGADDLLEELGEIGVAPVVPKPAATKSTPKSTKKGA